MLKIAPHPKKASPDVRTNIVGTSRYWIIIRSDAPSSAKARKMASSRPMRSESQPKAGRVKPPETGAEQSTRQGRLRNAKDGNRHIGDAEVAGHRLHVSDHEQPWHRRDRHHEVEKPKCSTLKGFARREFATRLHGGGTGGCRGLRGAREAHYYSSQD